MTKCVTPDVKTGIPSIISDDNGMPVFYYRSVISAHTNGDIHR